MKNSVQTFGKSRVLMIDPARQLASEQAFMDLIGETFGLEIDCIGIPAASLPEAFFELRTGLAGAILQKLVNYRLRAAIIGDIAEATAASKSLRDFVGESNRGGHVWFVADEAELARRLAG